MTKIKVLAKSEKLDKYKYAPGGDIRNCGGGSIKYDAFEIAGRSAGVCYGDYGSFFEDFENNYKPFKRAKFVKDNGHHSCFDHYHITLEVQTNKMIAMVLNSCGVYATSEKSARYTKMNPKTEKESELYNKWVSNFEPMIKSLYGTIYSDKDINKLAMENARYMTSVFTPTYMIYTISYRQACYICNYIDKFEKDLDYYYNELNNKNWHDYEFLNILVSELHELKSELINALFEKDKDDEAVINSFMLINNKDERFRFFDFNNCSKKTYIGDAYTIDYSCSLACLAQAQRHRTLRYSFDINLLANMKDLVIDNYNSGNTELIKELLYIPEIIKKTPFEKEWISDMVSLIEDDVYVQGLKVNVIEQGIIEDFILKCKERLCSRAQLEICNLTQDELKEMINAKDNISEANYYELSKMVEDKNGFQSYLPRCKFGFNCTQPCKYGVNGLNRNI